MTEQERWDAYRAAVKRHWTLVPLAVNFSEPDALGCCALSKFVDGGVWNRVRSAEDITAGKIEQIVRENPRHL